MATGNAAGWRSTLAEIEQAIGDCLTALDRYEAAFARVLGVEPAHPGSEPEARSAEEPSAWDGRLAAAGEAADAVERLLAEQEAVWGRWRAALADWRRLAGGEGGTVAGSPASNGEGGP
jgi:hypothetical protein